MLECNVVSCVDESGDEDEKDKSSSSDGSAWDGESESA